MESILTAVIIITVLLFAMLMLSNAFISAQDTLHTSWQQMQARVGAQAETRLALVDTEFLSEGAVLEVTLGNEGTIQLADFDRWDAIIQYYDMTSAYYIRRLNYLEGAEPITDEWTVKGIYVDAAAAAPELYGRGILDPGEQMVVRMRVSPAIDENTAALVTFSAENGERISALAVPSP
jgi:hypothetical protein